MVWLQHYLSYLHYPIAVIGTIGVFVIGYIIYFGGSRYIDARFKDPREHYRKRTYPTTSITVLGRRPWI